MLINFVFSSKLIYYMLYTMRHLSAVKSHPTRIYHYNYVLVYKIRVA